jgi:type IV secretory pathway TraG/TraD family ATPase VirD4
VFFFVRIRVFTACLVLAYAYDLWFRFWSGSLSLAMLITNYPVWTVLVMFMALFGFLYRGFRFRWWFTKPVPQGRNSFLE